MDLAVVLAGQSRTNTNRLQFAPGCTNPRETTLAPVSERGGALELETVWRVEAAPRIYELELEGMNVGEDLETSHSRAAPLTCD